MKKILFVATLIISTSVFTSCKKEESPKPIAPVQNLSGFMKDISSAD